MSNKSKATNNSHDRIMEIVGLLLRKIIEEPEEAQCEESLVKCLEERGYRRSEIDAAIELVFAVPEIIAPTVSARAETENTKTVRVFSPVEERKLSLMVRGRLIEYRNLGLITEAEWEEILIQLMLAEGKEVGLADLHFVLRKVVGDWERLLLLVPGQGIWATSIN